MSSWDSCLPGWKVEGLVVWKEGSQKGLCKSPAGDFCRKHGMHMCKSQKLALGRAGRSSLRLSGAATCPAWGPQASPSGSEGSHTAFNPACGKSLPSDAQPVSSVSVMSDSLWPHGLLPTRLSCQSPSPGVNSDSCPSSQWCHQPYPLSSPSPSTFSVSQHQDLFQWVSFSHQVAKVLELQLQHQSFQWLFRTDFL